MYGMIKGTQVETSTGDRNIEEIKVGDMVKTVGGEVKVIKTLRSMNPVFQFIVDGRIITMTGRIKVHVLSKTSDEISSTWKYSWKEVKDIINGDVLTVDGGKECEIQDFHLVNAGVPVEVFGIKVEGDKSYIIENDIQVFSPRG